MLILPLLSLVLGCLSLLVQELVHEKVECCVLNLRKVDIAAEFFHSEEYGLIQLLDSVMGQIGRSLIICIKLFADQLMFGVALRDEVCVPVSPLHG